MMRLALEQAARAKDLGEVPVGAVLLDASGEVIATGFNRTIADHDPTAHAEIVALRAAAREVKNYRLPGATLYVTLEPCAMCLGAMLHARLGRIVFAAADPKTGACGSVVNLLEHATLNHQTVLTSGILAEECGTYLRDFFRDRRGKAKQADPLDAT
jgi:tRNA(adenine34) deaminase